MTSTAASERALLADLAEQLGPDAPTLCEGWDVQDLLVHLLVREGSPSALVGSVRPVRRLVERVSGRPARKGFPDLVRALRGGPPLLSPFNLPVVGAALNSGEFFIHHEDVRRAQPGWAPRTLPQATEDALWRQLRLVGRAVTAKAPVGVAVERADTGERATLHRGDPEVVLTGTPSELLLYAFGRQRHAVVDARGPEDAVAALAGARLGV